MSFWNFSKDLKLVGKPKRNFYFHDKCVISKNHPNNLAELKEQKANTEK